MAKILVVDDSEILRTQLRMALEGAGHSVVEAENGIRGLEVLKGNEDVKIIFCDLNMPEMDGITMCSKVTSDEKFKGVPIFMLTTESSNEMRTKGKEIGIKGWIIKPFVADKIIAAITKVI